MRALRTWSVLIAATWILGCGGPTAQPVPSRTPSPSSNSTIEGDEAQKLPTFPSPPPAAASPSPATPSAEYVTASFNDIQAQWRHSFEQAGLRYVPARLRIFTSAVGTACGSQTSDVGPFYCPGDQSVNLDLTFFVALERRYNVGGFAQAYVIAHEVGHHVQFLLGISERVAIAQQRDPAGANALSVRQELQADCFAGAWAHTAYGRDLVGSGDIEQALNAAAVVGDDFQANLHGGQLQPESWTHGSSAQRRHWFTVGFDSGSANSCDTFSGPV